MDGSGSKQLTVVGVGPPSGAKGDARGDRHLCRRCGSRRTYPLEWERAGPGHWMAFLRCPDCEWAGSCVFGRDAVDRFDEELERGSEALRKDLKRITRANMADELARLAAALEADALLPVDF